MNRFLVLLTSLAAFVVIACAPPAGEEDDVGILFGQVRGRRHRGRHEPHGHGHHGRCNPRPDGSAGAGDADGGAGGAGGTGGEGGVALECRWIGDFDGDGIADCARTATGATARLDLLFNKGLAVASYAAISVVTPGVVPPNAYTFAVFDLNHDSRQDIIVDFADPAAPNDHLSLQLFRGQADGSFIPFAAAPPLEGLGGVAGSLLYLPSSSSLPPSPQRLDFDGDGWEDLFGIASLPNLYTQYYWVVIKSAGGLDFAFKQTPAYYLRGLAIPSGFADLNGDGKLDVAAVARNNPVPGLTTYVGVSYGTGDGGFLAAVQIAGTDGATAVSITDVNNDGHLDLLVTMPAGPTAFHGDGAGHFSTTAP